MQFIFCVYNAVKTDFQHSFVYGRSISYLSICILLGFRTERMESAEILQEIPPLVLKNLCDRSYEKRKAAASEIESIVHQMHVGLKEGCKRLGCWGQ